MKTYQIKKGESLAEIAKRYGVTAASLATVNGLRDPYSVSSGTQLQIPEPSGETAAQTASRLAAAETKPAGYAESDEVKAARSALQNAEAAAPQSYRGRFEDSVKKLYEDYISAEPFSYNQASDPLYHALRDQTLASARRASEESLAAASSLTGGRASSYAQSVAADAYNRSVSALSEKLPELYNAAYSRYKDANAQRADRLSAAMKLDSAEYDRYRDTVSDYRDDLNYYYAKYGDLSKRDYEKYRDNIDLWQKDRAYYYTKNADAIERETQDTRDTIELAQREREFALQLQKFEQEKLEFAEQQRQFEQKQKEFEQELAFRRYSFDKELNYKKGWWYL